MSVRPGHHYGLSEDEMALVLHEVEKRLALMSYDQIAIAIKKSPGAARKLMQEILRERRAGIIREHRGTRREKEFLVEQAEREIESEGMPL